MDTIKVNLALPKDKNKNKNSIYYINLCGIIKTFKTEPGAWRYLEKLGFVYNYDTGLHERTRKSFEEIRLNENYTTYIY